MTGVPLEPLTDLRLHLGAPKTATTHVQQSLAAHRDALAALGVDFIPLEHLRPLLLQLSLRNWRAALGGPVIRRAVRRDLAALRRGPGRLVLSEENLLGHMGDALLGEPFTRAGRKLRLMRHVAGRAKLSVFVTIRSFDTLLPSIYAQVLRHQPAPDFARVRARIHGDPPSWVGVIERVRAAAPGADLHVWVYDDYRANSRAMLSDLCGVDIGDPPALATPQSTRTPTAEGVAAAEALDMPKGPARFRRVQALYGEAMAAGGAPFNPLDDAERARLRARFDEDLARIETIAPGALRRF